MKKIIVVASCFVMLIASGCSENEKNGSDNDVHSSGTWDESMDGERRNKDREHNRGDESQPGSTTGATHDGTTTGMTTGGTWYGNDSMYHSKPSRKKSNKNNDEAPENE